MRPQPPTEVLAKCKLSEVFCFLVCEPSCVRWCTLFHIATLYSTWMPHGRPRRSSTSPTYTHTHELKHDYRIGFISWVVLVSWHFTSNRFFLVINHKILKKEPKTFEFISTKGTWRRDLPVLATPARSESGDLRLRKLLWWIDFGIQFFMLIEMFSQSKTSIGK